MMGPLITQSLAQLQASEHAVAKPGAAKKPADARARRRPEDAYETIASAVDPSRALRALSSNEQEDAKEDKQEHQRLPTTRDRSGERSHLDVNG